MGQAIKFCGRCGESTTSTIDCDTHTPDEREGTLIEARAVREQWRVALRGGREAVGGGEREEVVGRKPIEEHDNWCDMRKGRDVCTCSMSVRVTHAPEEVIPEVEMKPLASAGEAMGVEDTETVKGAPFVFTGHTFPGGIKHTFEQGGELTRGLSDQERAENTAAASGNMRKTPAPGDLIWVFKRWQASGEGEREWLAAHVTRVAHGTLHFWLLAQEPHATGCLLTSREWMWPAHEAKHFHQVKL